MKKFLVSFEVSVTQSKDTFVVSQPDYIFSGEFDKDDHESCQDLLVLESMVVNLIRCFDDLGCQVIASKKEICSLDL